jgi:hypothetical protein
MVNHGYGKFCLQLFGPYNPQPDTKGRRRNQLCKTGAGFCWNLCYTVITKPLIHQGHHARLRIAVLVMSSWPGSQPAHRPLFCKDKSPLTAAHSPFCGKPNTQPRGKNERYFWMCQVLNGTRTGTHNMRASYHVSIRLSSKASPLRNMLPRLGFFVEVRFLRAGYLVQVLLRLHASKFFLGMTRN